MTYGLEGRCSIQLSYWRSTALPPEPRRLPDRTGTSTTATRVSPHIGTARFELATPRSQSECSTGLSHVPYVNRENYCGVATPSRRPVCGCPEIAAAAARAATAR